MKGHIRRQLLFSRRENKGLIFDDHLVWHSSAVNILLCFLSFYPDCAFFNCMAEIKMVLDEMQLLNENFILCCFTSSFPFTAFRRDVPAFL